MEPRKLAEIRVRDAKMDEHLHSRFEGSPLLMESLKACISHAEYDRRALLKYVDNLTEALELLVALPVTYNGNRIEIEAGSHGEAMEIVRKARSALACSTSPSDGLSIGPSLSDGGKP